MLSGEYQRLRAECHLHAIVSDSSLKMIDDDFHDSIISLQELRSHIADCFIELDMSPQQTHPGELRRVIAECKAAYSAIHRVHPMRDDDPRKTAMHAFADMLIHMDNAIIILENIYWEVF